MDGATEELGFLAGGVNILPSARHDGAEQRMDPVAYAIRASGRGLYRRRRSICGRCASSVSLARTCHRQLVLNPAGAAIRSGRLGLRISIAALVVATRSSPTYKCGARAGRAPYCSPRDGHAECASVRPAKMERPTPTSSSFRSMSRCGTPSRWLPVDSAAGGTIPSLLEWRLSGASPSRRAGRRSGAGYFLGTHETTSVYISLWLLEPRLGSWARLGRSTFIGTRALSLSTRGGPLRGLISAHELALGFK